MVGRVVAVSLLMAVLLLIWHEEKGCCFIFSRDVSLCDRPSFCPQRARGHTHGGKSGRREKISRRTLIDFPFGLWGDCVLFALFRWYHDHGHGAFSCLREWPQQA